MGLLHATDTVTVEAFLALPECDEWMEWVDGEIIVTPRPSSEHQIIVAYLSYLLHRRLEGQGCLLVEKEVLVRSADGRPRVRCPDLIFVREMRRDIIRSAIVDGPPDLLIEVLSPATAEVDRLVKRDEYRATGVDEYWIVDLEDRVVLIHDFPESSRSLYRRGETFVSRVFQELGLDARFRVDDLFRALD